MKCNEAGLQIIRDSESLRLEAYLCPAGIPTVAWGHTGPDVKLGMAPITRARADQLLARDVAAAERQVERVVRVPLTSNQFSALVSLCFNIGTGRFARADIVGFLNSGDLTRAEAEFPLWCHCDGRVEPGLVTRRARELALFRTK